MPITRKLITKLVIRGTPALNALPALALAELGTWMSRTNSVMAMAKIASLENRTLSYSQVPRPCQPPQSRPSRIRLRFAG
jgi:hypothetical protein